MQRFDGSRLLSMGDRLVNCMGGDLISFDPLTGKKNWRLALIDKSDDRNESAALPPAAAGGRLFVATRAGQLLKVNPQNGSIDGRFDIGKTASTQPILDDGRIVLGTTDGELIMLKTKDRTLTGWNQWGGNAIHSGIAESTAKRDILAHSNAEPRRDTFER
jgi:outer membrane protein assembly factor BamB